MENTGKSATEIEAVIDVFNRIYRQEMDDATRAGVCTHCHGTNTHRPIGRVAHWCNDCRTFYRASPALPGQK